MCVGADAGDVAGCELLKGMRDVWDEQAATAKGLQRLKAKLLEEVQHVRQLTGAVEDKASHRGRAINVCMYVTCACGR